MPASFQEIINSRLFKFIVGETSDGIPTEFSVHEEAIAQLSTPLHSLVKSGLSESQAGCTIWKDVSKETFERLVQFAYTGDYSIPEAKKRNRAVKPEGVEKNAPAHRASSSNLNGIQTWNKAQEPNEPFNIKETVEDAAFLDEPAVLKEQEMEEPKVYETAEEPAVDVFNDWGYWGISKKKGKNKGKTTSRSDFDWDQSKREIYPVPPSVPLAADFHSLSFPLLAPRNSYNNTCEPAEHFEPGQSYSNVFLAHAALYVLGDYRLIDSLKALALYKLHKTLCVFQLDDENVEDVVDLARYAYSEEGQGFEGGIGGLRSLVCQYLATNAVVLSLDAGFMDLLGEGGQFVKDFFKFELLRMH